MTLKQQLETIFREAECDKYGGMSALSDTIDLFDSLNSEEKEVFIREFNELIYSAENNKLLQYAGLVSGMWSNNIMLKGSYDMIMYRLTKEYSFKKPDRELIKYLEYKIKVYTKMKNQNQW